MAVEKKQSKTTKAKKKFNTKELLTKIIQFTKKSTDHDSLKYLWQLIVFIAIYGVLITFTIHFIFNWVSISIYSIVAFGIAFYFVKNELPEIMQKLYPPRD